MDKPRQFSLRTLLLATALIAIGCWAVATAGPEGLIGVIATAAVVSIPYNLWRRRSDAALWTGAALLLFSPLIVAISTVKVGFGFTNEVLIVSVYDVETGEAIPNAQVVICDIRREGQLPWPKVPLEPGSPPLELGGWVEITGVQRDNVGRLIVHARLPFSDREGVFRTKYTVVGLKHYYLGASAPGYAIYEPTPLVDSDPHVYPTKPLEVRIGLRRAAEAD